jgi:hypothetical protein
MVLSATYTGSLRTPPFGTLTMGQITAQILLTVIGEVDQDFTIWVENENEF